MSKRGVLSKKASRSVLVAAAEKNDLPALSSLLESTSISGDTKNSEDGLRIACTNGHAKIVSKLLDAGVDPAASDIVGLTPLHYAARQGRFDCVKVLCEHKLTPINAVDHRNHTPLLYAAMRGFDTCVAQLLQAGADFSICGTANASPVFAACIEHVNTGSKEALKIIQLLADAGASMDIGKTGVTPLMFSVSEGDLVLAELLIKRGANVNMGDENGATALVKAITSENEEGVDFLLSKGADPEVPLKADLWRAIHGAAFLGYASIVTRLLKAGADPTAKTSEGETASKLALKKGFKSLSKSLKKAEAKWDPATGTAAAAKREKRRSKNRSSGLVGGLGLATSSSTREDDIVGELGLSPRHSIGRAVKRLSGKFIGTGTATSASESKEI